MVFCEKNRTMLIFVSQHIGAGWGERVLGEQEKQKRSGRRVLCTDRWLWQYSCRAAPCPVRIGRSRHPSRRMRRCWRAVPCGSAAFGCQGAQCCHLSATWQTSGSLARYTEGPTSPPRPPRSPLETPPSPAPSPSRSSASLRRMQRRERKSKGSDVIADTFWGKRAEGKQKLQTVVPTIEPKHANQ